MTTRFDNIYHGLEKDPGGRALSSCSIASGYLSAVYLLPAPTRFCMVARDVFYYLQNSGLLRPVWDGNLRRATLP
jgi:hypothetical protein